MQNTLYDLSVLNWTLTGYQPCEWDMRNSAELGENLAPDIKSIPANVPGSVQGTLLNSRLIPDWNISENYRLCEWVENRQWLFETSIPENWIKNASRYILKIDGLDFKGRIYINSNKVYEFSDGFSEHKVELTEFLDQNKNSLKIIFDYPPRWLGQIAYTSKIKDLKPRYNYGWDWTRRLVQIGIYGGIFIEEFDSVNIKDIRVYTDYDIKNDTGGIYIDTDIESDCKVFSEIKIYDANKVILSTKRQLDGSLIRIEGLNVSTWWPNGMGEQKIYKLSIQILDDKDKYIKEIVKIVGFKKITWKNCKGVPDNCAPWICCINGHDIFLQGVNWTPIRPNFADVKKTDYHLRLKHYKDMGFNLIRIWGGGYLENDYLYDLCDQFGLMIWQEFPLCSSGIDNHPPTDSRSIHDMKAIAESYIKRRQHHASLILWCGGNELQTTLDGSPGLGAPLDNSNIMIGELEEVVRLLDPYRRFLPTSPSGPRTYATEIENFNKNLHWDVHGPWKARGFSHEQWLKYWIDEDSYFRSEIGLPGPSPVDITRKYKGSLSELPISTLNPLWLSSSWWLESLEFNEEYGREPLSLEEYVKWGQTRQCEWLCLALKHYKAKFPRCGGFIIWMGHDSYPCPTNTSLIDFEGNLKPAAVGLKEILKLPFHNQIQEK